MTALVLLILACPTPTQSIEHFLVAQRNVPAARAHATANQIVYCANLTKLDPFVLVALIDVETGETWRRTTRGKSGEIGLTQILPRTARACGYDVGRLRRSRDYQILCGAYYLAGQQGGIEEKLQRYNGGPHGPKKERCKRYARKVLANARKVARRR